MSLCSPRLWPRKPHSGRPLAACLHTPLLRDRHLSSLFPCALTVLPVKQPVSSSHKPMHRIPCCSAAPSGAMWTPWRRLGGTRRCGKLWIRLASGPRWLPWRCVSVIVIITVVLRGDLGGRIEDAGPLHARRQVSQACLSHSAEPLQGFERRHTFSDGGKARLGQLWLQLHGGCKLPGLTQRPQAQGCLHAHSCDARGCWWSGSSHISRVGGSPGPTLGMLWHATTTMLLPCREHHGYMIRLYAACLART